MMFLPGWLTAFESDSGILIVCESARRPGDVNHSYRVRVWRADVETSTRWCATETEARQLFERTVQGLCE